MREWQCLVCCYQDDPASTVCDDVDDQGVPLQALDNGSMGPRGHFLCTYCPIRQPVGTPVSRTSVLYFGQQGHLQEVEISIYAHGFTLNGPSKEETEQPQGGVLGTTYSWISWSPFSVLGRCADLPYGIRLNILNVCDDQTHYFMPVVKDEEARVRDRDTLMKAVATALVKLTDSLFPQHEITVWPLPDRESSSRRIMAGYLLLCESYACASLVYCDLSAYFGGKASLTIYTDDGCSHEVRAVEFTSSVFLGTYKGLHCNTFDFHNFRFCSRTREEKTIWYRALANVVTKLVVGAPDPTVEELRIFRMSVLEQVKRLALDCKRKQFASVALLPSNLRRPLPPVPIGDVTSPRSLPDEPISDGVKQGDSSGSDNSRSVRDLTTGDRLEV